MIFAYIPFSNDDNKVYSFPVLSFQFNEVDAGTHHVYGSLFQEHVDTSRINKIYRDFAARIGVKFDRTNHIDLYGLAPDGTSNSLILQVIYDHEQTAESLRLGFYFYSGSTPLTHFNTGLTDDLDFSQWIDYDLGFRRASDTSNRDISSQMWLYDYFSGHCEIPVYDPAVRGYYVVEYGGVTPPGHVKTAITDCIHIHRIGTSESYIEFPEFGDSTTNPYVQAGISEEGGGFGTFFDTNTLIDLNTYAPLPTLSAVSAGFVTLYNPSLLELQNLASYMWSDLFSIDTLKRIFADPIDTILGLSIVPVAVPDGGQKIVSIGNVSTGISMTKAASQYVSLDCGVLDVKEFWGSALDYEPNTKFTLYLPYIGYKQIHADDIMGKTIQITYRVDILTGSCVAFVICGGSVLYQFEGVCASQMPVTSNDWRNTLSAIVRTVGTAAGAIGEAGALGAGVSAASVTSGLSNTVNSVMGAKPQVHRSGNVSGSGGMLSVQSPYLIKIKPRQSMPESYNKYGGFPSNISAQLGSLSGFTAIEEIHLENINATDAELDEIENLLREGVIL